MNPNIRDGLMIAGLGVIILGVFLWLGVPAAIQLLVIAVGYALVALGLNVQWGYAGQFNFGVMGFLMLGAWGVVVTSYPINAAFWDSEGPLMLFRTLLVAAMGALLIMLANRVDRIGIRGGLKVFLVVVAWGIAYIAFRSQIDPAATYIETQVKQGFVGGLGLPVLRGWVIGGVIAAAIAYLNGKACLGLRTDYLAIATIGIGEIIRALLKNMDWLTRGTLTVSPIPWPVPTALDIAEKGTNPELSLVFARSMFLSLLVVVVAVIFLLLQRAYNGPWGRMMRAIRDNHVAAEAMGKDVKRRQIEIFVLGSVLMGIGGAVLSTYTQLFDPGGYMPITHTFVVWVMVIVGGAGNNLGALFGGVLIIIAWNMSEPLSRLAFTEIDRLSQYLGLGAIPDLDARALQMRVFLLGLVITFALRYAPRGLIPERIRSHH
jgi:branched-chain amino acid transport system permease protein